MSLFGFLNEREVRFFQSKKGQAFFGFVVISIFLFGYLTQSTIFANENRLSTIYHVYVDNQYIGKVNDQSVVEGVVESKLNTEESDSLDLVIAEDITYVSERAFNPDYHNDQTAKKLSAKLSIKAVAYELKIGDETLGYFSDEEEANEVVTKYLKTYVDDEDFEEYQSKVLSSPITEDYIDVDEIQSKTDTPSLSVGESQLVEMSLNENVEVNKRPIELDEMISVKEGLKLLQKGTLEEEKHIVAEGDVLESIASEYDLTTKELLKLNSSLSEDTLLQIDDELNVTEFKPFVDVIVTEEKLVEEKVNYETEVIESDELYKGEQKVKQEGKDGKQKVRYKVEKTNGSETDREVLHKKEIDKPTKKIVVKGTKVIPSRGSGVLAWPTNGGYVSSGYGYRWGRLHKGMDIARPSNRTIKAADHGVVSQAGYEGGYGNKIVINHNNGMKTIYAHLSSINVQVGQTIEKGSPIGVMGSTGNSTGIHLHFEVHQNGSIQNPQKYF